MSEQNSIDKINSNQVISGIYKIENLINHKVYIGQSKHIERRWAEHCHPSAKSLISKAIKKYGKNRPLYMLIIFYVLMVGSIALLILLYYSNYYNYLDDLNIFNTQPDKQVAYREFLQKDIQAHNAIIVTLVLSFVDLLIVSTAPLVQSKLKKLKFKQIDENAQYEGKKENK